MMGRFGARGADINVKTINHINMTYPAGNSNWAWEWMGFSPPCTFGNAKIKDGYNKFIHCFGVYYGVGDFCYWKRSELIRLSDDDKLELVNLLLLDNKDKTDARRYLGLNDDGSINKDFIDEFADSRTVFFGLLTIEECRKQKYPHNQRSRHTDGFYCYDCGTFIPKESEEYLRNEGLDSYDMSIHNICADFHIKEIDLPEDLIDLRRQFDELNKKNCYDVKIEEIESIIAVYNEIKDKYAKIHKTKRR